MTIAYRIIVFIIIAILALPFYGLTIHLLIKMGIFPNTQEANGILTVITEKAVLIWMSCLVLGVISLFIKEKWRIAFLLAPLFAPSLFAIFYSLSL